MAITNFKKNVWESAILEQYKGMSIADLITKKPTRVDGSKAIFGTASLTKGLQTYTGTVAFEEATTGEIPVVFDKAKYFAFSVGDIDKVQLAGDIMMPLANEMAYAIKKDIDTAVLTEAVAGAKTKIGTTSAKKSIATADQAYEFVVDLGSALDKKDVPENGRYVIASPDFVNLLAKDKRVIDNAPVLQNGVMQGMEVNGMQVIKSNNVPADTVIALHNSAVGYGKQIDEVEAMRLQNSFSDGLRGLVNYGVKTLQGEGIAVLYYTIA